jgi:hypothetical protein
MNPWIYHRGDQTPNILQMQTPDYTSCGRWRLGGVSIPTNVDPWIYQRWNQVPDKEHSYKCRTLDIPEMGSGTLEE